MTQYYLFLLIISMVGVSRSRPESFIGTFVLPFCGFQITDCKLKSILHNPYMRVVFSSDGRF